MVISKYQLAKKIKKKKKRSRDVVNKINSDFIRINKTKTTQIHQYTQVHRRNLNDLIGRFDDSSKKKNKKKLLTSHV